MSLKPFFLLICLSSTLPLLAQKSYTLSSPDGSLQATITASTDLRVALTAQGAPILAPSPLSITLVEGEVLGLNPKVTRVERHAEELQIASPLYKKSSVRDCYNELSLAMRGRYGVIFRLYDDGLAYRFTTQRDGEMQIATEQVALTFPADYPAYVAHVNRGKSGDFESQFPNSFENTYVKRPLTQLDAQRLIFLPMLVELPQGRKMLITEADLQNYPGLYLRSSATAPTLTSVLAPYPKREEQGGHNRLQMLVKEREAYIAQVSGTRAFPWRVMIVSNQDKELLDNDMVYRLAPASQIPDCAWIKPGKVAWDWWNSWNLYGVDFKAGINNQTYKYYIDFAAKQGLEYVILDEGWAVNKKADLMQVIPEIDLRELVEYGRQRNVGIILWAGYLAFDRDLEQVVKHYAELGVKGFKVDFMDRDDQKMVDFLHRAAKLCAQHKMLLDFHGIFKPTGLNRTWPNVLNYEGVFGLEQMKWSPEADMVSYDVTMPFIRMVAGPLDYTQGAMRNAAKGNYRPINSEPMSQGTRCRQLAEYVIFESPITMLCDSPSNYLQEPESIGFIAQIPTVWDQTVAVAGAVGEYIAIARRSGDVWYLGATSSWKARDLELDLSFLGAGDYLIESFADGLNADKAARDYTKQTAALPQERKLSIHLAPGGGYAARITAQ